MSFRLYSLLAAIIFPIALSGCPKKAVVKPIDDLKTTEASQNPDAVAEPSLRGKEYKDVPEIGVIYFDLDSSSLRADARDTLEKNAKALRENANWEALVEGHCDERGTTEYNLGLGQKRAASVRQYYMSLGISGTRIATISYGKESPICSESTEDCWTKNRRGATKVRINPDAKK
jgi:peptidoglycan-associated lipoprotein